MDEVLAVDAIALNLLTDLDFAHGTMGSGKIRLM